MTKIIILKYLFPFLLLILFLRFYKRSTILEKVKRVVRFEYLFPRIVFALILLSSLLWGLGHLIETINPQEGKYISDIQGGRSGSLPPPTHGRKSKMP